jgi:hypothetical protein
MASRRKSAVQAGYSFVVPTGFVDNGVRYEKMEGAKVAESIEISVLESVLVHNLDSSL